MVYLFSGLYIKGCPIVRPVRQQLKPAVGQVGLPCHLSLRTGGMAAHSWMPTSKAYNAPEFTH